MPTEDDAVLLAEVIDKFDTALAQRAIPADTRRELTVMFAGYVFSARFDSAYPIHPIPLGET